MPSTGLKLPGSASAVTGSWTTVGNLTANDGSTASVTPAKNASATARGSTFGISVPSGATVTSVVVQVRWREASASSTYTGQVAVNVGGTPVYTSSAEQMTATLATYYYDITAQRAWADTDFADGTLTVDVVFTRGNTNTAVVCHADYVGISVGYYTTTPQWTVVSDPSTAVNASATARTSTALTSPAGTQSGDYLIAYITQSTGTQGASSPPDGTWTRADTQTQGSTVYAEWYYKKLSAAADATYTFTHGSTVTTGAIFALRGADGTTLLDRAIQAGDWVGDATAPYDVPQIATSTDNALVFTTFSGEWTGSGLLDGTPAGYTQIVLYSDALSTCKLAIHYKEITPAGTTPAVTYALSAAKNMVVGQFALKPGAGAVYADMTAAGTLALTGTATAQVLVPLASTRAITISGTAAAQVVVPLTASGSIAVAGTGTLSVVSPYVDMAATVAVTLGGSASVAVVVPLAGSGTVGIQGSGTAAVLVPLSASGALSLGGSAALQDVVPLAASGAALVVGTGTLTIKGIPYVDMTATGAVALGGSTAMQVLVPLSASNAAGVTGAGALLVVVPLTASAAITAAGTAGMDVLVALAGAGSVEVTGTGTLILAGAVVAADLEVAHALTTGLAITHAIGSQSVSSTQVVRTAVGITHARIEV